MILHRLATAASVLLVLLTLHTCSDLVHADELGEHGFADSDGVKIHYVTAGEGPLVVMIHGFPDFWYTWRNQMPQLSKNFKVVAIDQRGYNKSDQPEGVENYGMDKLTSDVKAVIEHFDQEKAIIVGHDWGGAVSWSFSMMYPQMVDRLVILNLPHPAGMSRELANNPKQAAASEYARNFQQPGAHKALSPQRLAFWVKDKDARARHLEALERSSLQGMLNYYVANYPKPPYEESSQSFPKIKCPVLVIHGLADPVLLPNGNNSTWDHIDNELTLMTIPGAGHFVQHDAADRVTRTIDVWLRQDKLN